MNRNISDRINWKTVLLSLIVSIVAAYFSGLFQYFNNVQERKVQLYLDEKKGFVSGCEEFLKQYRIWHELMNHFICIENDCGYISEHSDNSFEEYKKWKKDFDFSYGRLFLLSDNEFGSKTIEISAVLHGSLETIIFDSLCNEFKSNILYSVDSMFYKDWLLPAQLEIFKYNSGNRKTKTLQQYLEERNTSQDEQIKEQNEIDRMYESLKRASGNVDFEDSRMPTREEFEKLVKDEVR